MQNLQEAANIGELKPGTMKMVNIEGHEYLIARVEDKYFAADNRCPHMGGNLSQGKLEGTIITCPRHGSQFDLKDGHVIRWTTWSPALVAIDQVRSHKRPLPIYPVVVEGSKIQINRAKVLAEK
jgi:3-phenylpropionate/trans-cinnamate dioxygenase ferredoxin component